MIEYNSTGLMKFNKETQKHKIDGMVVLAMCMGEYLDYLKAQEENAQMEMTLA